MSGALIGMFTGLGIVLITRVLAQPKSSMADSIARYVGAGTTQQRNLTYELIQRVQRLFTSRQWAPWESDFQISRKLRQLDTTMSLGAVRRKQVIAAAISLLIALLWVILRLASDKPLSTMIALLICVSAFTYGGWYVKWSLESKTSQRISAIEAQLPAVLDLLAFAISAGEPALLAIRRVAETCSGPLTRELKKVLNSIDSGESLARSLNNLSADLDSQALSRAFHALTLALERGTPLAQVLRAQAADARAQQARLLLVLAGRKETAMMLPVVFLILPMIVAVALYPGIVALQVL